LGFRLWGLWAFATCACGVLGLTPALLLPIEVLRSTGGLPAHIAGSFQNPIGFQQADNGQYFVFDRRAHAVYTVMGDSVKKVIEIGAETGRVLDPSAFDIDPADGSFVIGDAPFDGARIQTFTASGGRLGGFSLPGRHRPRVTMGSFVLSGIGSIQFTGETILINQPEQGSLITELAFDGTPRRAIGELRVTGQSDVDVHLALNGGFPLVDPTGGFYFVFSAGVPTFRRYDARGRLVFERHIEGAEVDPYLRTMPTSWPKRRADATVLPIVPAAIRAAGVDRTGRLWVALTTPVTYVYDASGDKVRTVQFRGGAGVLTPNSLYFTKDGRVLVTPGCYEFRVP
jgi:hypothetical protein